MYLNSKYRSCTATTDRTEGTSEKFALSCIIGLKLRAQNARAVNASRARHVTGPAGRPRRRIFATKRATCEKAKRTLKLSGKCVHIVHCRKILVSGEHAFCILA